MDTDFLGLVRRLGPRMAVVLGSGLGAAAAAFRERAAVPFLAVPGLVPPSVPGHAGRFAVGDWAGVPVVVVYGRLHLYEGHPPEVVTGPVRLMADLGVRCVVLTNAAGGIRPDLVPGTVLALRGHLALIGPTAWKRLAAGSALATPYSAALLARLADLPVGVYAGVTGPCYETPAEIRALAACGADAVGMSTVLEAEAAAARGMHVVGLSCVTNAAAGLTDTPLDHRDVLARAAGATTRLADVLTRLVRCDLVTI